MTLACACRETNPCRDLACLLCAFAGRNRPISHPMPIFRVRHSSVVGGAIDDPCAALIAMSQRERILGKEGKETGSNKSGLNVRRAACLVDTRTEGIMLSLASSKLSQ